MVSPASGTSQIELSITLKIHVEPAKSQLNWNVATAKIEKIATNQQNRTVSNQHNRIKPAKLKQTSKINPHLEPTEQPSGTTKSEPSKLNSHQQNRTVWNRQNRTYWNEPAKYIWNQQNQNKIVKSQPTKSKIGNQSPKSNRLKPSKLNQTIKIEANQ